MIKQNFIFPKNVVYFLIFNIFIISSVFAQNNTEITLTIDSLPTTAVSLQFNNAEKLRQEFKFADAIKEYETVINSTENSNLKAEAVYNIGLCYTWINDLNNADLFFKKAIDEYKSEPLVVSFAQYGLSWIKVQEGKYYDAIEILENELNRNECKDYEHNAVMMFQLGKIYQKYLLDFNKAEDIYKNLIASYPKAKIISHPFLSHLTN